MERIHWWKRLQFHFFPVVRKEASVALGRGRPFPSAESGSATHRAGNGSGLRRFRFPKAYLGNIEKFPARTSGRGNPGPKGPCRDSESEIRSARPGRKRRPSAEARCPPCFGRRTGRRFRLGPPNDREGFGLSDRGASGFPGAEARGSNQDGDFLDPETRPGSSL